MIALAASLAMAAVIARSLDRLAGADRESRAVKATRMMLWAFAAVVVVEAALGAAGLLTPLATLFVLAGVAAVTALAARRRPPVEPRPPERVSAPAIGMLAALLAVLGVALWTGMHRTAFLYDTLSYHLHVPASWMHERRIGIVPAVFGDPAPAYAPANLELWFLFLMAPLRSDALAGVGQLPLAALAAAAIVAVHREGGAGSLAVGLGGALAFLLIPEVWGQMPTAMSDLGLAAFLLAALPFVVRLATAPAPRRADLITAAAAIGLAIGTKYAAATLALPFAAVAAGAWLRRRPLDLPGAALAAAVLVATGGFWYARNAIVTGNPFYPVAVPGLSLPALYGRAEMRAWDYHLPVGDLRALASTWVAGGVGFTIATALALAGAWRRRALLASLLLVLVAIFWFVIPYQESRFLFTAFGVAATLIAHGAQRWAIVGLGGLLAAIVGSLLEWPTRDRLLLAPIGAAAGLLWWRLPAPLTLVGPRAGRLAGAGAAVVLLAAMAVATGGYDARDPGYTVGDELDAAWSWFRANVHDARVAYTGTNLAFPLAGERLGNRVSYVNVAGAPGARLHDFGPPGDGSAEPAPYRRGARAEIWLANLRAARTQVLFVAALYPIVRRTIAADPDGFPIERAWADARPAIFRLRHASAAARVYDVVAP